MLVTSALLASASAYAIFKGLSSKNKSLRKLPSARYKTNHNRNEISASSHSTDRKTAETRIIDINESDSETPIKIQSDNYLIGASGVLAITVSGVFFPAMKVLSVVLA